MGIQRFKKQAIALALAGLACQSAFAEVSEESNVDFGDNFKIAILPDTQYLTFNYPEIYLKQTEWLANVVAEEKIEYVIHVGDVVQKGQNHWEWLHANRAMKVLDENAIPYSTTIGNHDVDKSASSWELVNADNYIKYYGAHRFEDREDFVGASEDGLVTAFKLRMLGAGTELLILNMAIDPTEEHLEKGRELLAQHPDLPTILVTHRLVGENGEIGFTNNVFSGFETNDPIQMWDKFISKEDQIFMTINGHSSPAPSNGAYNIVRTNDNGLPVNQVLVDYQNLYEDEDTCSEVYPYDCGAKSGKGYLRIMNFDFEANTITHHSYSPHIDELEGDGNYLVGKEGYFLDKWNHYEDYINFQDRFSDLEPSEIEQIDVRIEYDDPENYGGNKWLTKTETSLPAGTYETITAKASPETERNNLKELDWRVKNPMVASIDVDPSTREATLTAKAVGTTTVIASHNGVDSNEITVTVTEPVSNIYALDIKNDSNNAFGGQPVEFDLKMASLDKVQDIELRFTILSKTIEDDKVEVTDSVYIDSGVFEARDGFEVTDYSYRTVGDQQDPTLGAMHEVTVQLECVMRSCSSDEAMQSIASISFETNPEVSTGKASKDDSYTEIDITRVAVNQGNDQAPGIEPTYAMESKDRVAFKLEYPHGDIAGEPTAGDFISDTKIDLADLAMVQRYLGSTSEHDDPYWRHIRWGSQRADIQSDGVIDMNDFHAIFELMDEKE